MTKGFVKNAITGGVAAVLVALSFLTPPGQAKGPTTIKREPRRVTTAAVEMGPSHVTFRAHGAVRARDRAVLSFIVPGRVVDRPVRVGDRVKAGQLLARVDARGYDHGARAAEATARQADAQLALHERDRVRLNQLGEAQAISRDKLEDIGSAVDAARASKDAAEVQLREARRTLRETELRAPFAATVVSVHVEPGEFAGPGQPIIVISGSAGFETEVDVPGRIAERLSNGAEAKARFPLDDADDVHAHVTSVGSSAGGPGRLFPVIVELEGTSHSVRAGAAVEVQLQIDSASQLTVPAAAILAPAGTDASVFRVANGRVERVPVTLGALFGRRVAVRAKLSETDRVIVAGYSGLVDGERVVESAP